MKTAARIMMAAMFLLALLPSVSSCDDTYALDTFSVDTIVVAKGHERSAFLVHNWDSTARVRVSDKMSSEMTIWRKVGNERTVAFHEIFYPEFNAKSVLLWDKDTVSREMLVPSLTKQNLKRGTAADGTTEVDTFYVYLNDGQKIWYPIQITNKNAAVDNTNYGFGSLVLLSASYNGATNQLISSSETAAIYNTCYKSTLTLQEKYVDNPKTFRVPVYAYATRTVLQNTQKDEYTVTVKGRNRTPIDSLTERIRFIEVFTNNRTGAVNEVEVVTTLSRKFEGENFSQQTYDFNYTRIRPNGISIGEETLVKKGENWTVYERLDWYSSTFGNGIGSDNFDSRYRLRHQRAVYKDAYVEVAFGYETTRIVEMKTKVTKQSATSAVLYNRINAIYLGFGQDLENYVDLSLRP